MRALAAGIAAALVLCIGGCGEEGEYPNRPITLIVPFPAGGSSDLIARVVSERAARELGQQIVIDNRPGAAGNIGTEAAARAAPDGYTLVECTIGTCGINHAIYKGLRYDLERDFEPIVLFGSLANILGVHPSVPAASVPELVDYAKRNPGKLTYGTSGYGSSPHLSGELFKQVAGIDVLHVPYRGSAPAINDLRGGQIHMFFDNAPSMLPHVKSGSVRALAVTGRERSPHLPDTPTMAELGYADFVISPWFGAMGVKGTPRAAIDKLNRAFNVALRDPDVQRRFAEMDVAPGGGSPEQFRELIRSEVARWGEFVRGRGIEAEELR
jgi:tripartite-type tricarboxylate transporter receptor subunit TctC